MTWTLNCHNGVLFALLEAASDGLLSCAIFNKVINLYFACFLSQVADLPNGAVLVAKMTDTFDWMILDLYHTRCFLLC